MRDLAHLSEGSRIVFCSSLDDRYSADNIIDGKGDTYWVSTGMYPQQLILSLPSLVNADAIQLQCYDVKSITIEKSSAEEPVNFTLLEKKEIPQDNRKITTVNFQAKTTAQHFRLTIDKAHDHFCSLHELRVMGNYKNES